MAVVILGGLVTSTLLNLFVVPSLYLRFGRGQQRRRSSPGSEGWRHDGRQILATAGGKASRRGRRRGSRMNVVFGERDGVVVGVSESGRRWRVTRAVCGWRLDFRDTGDVRATYAGTFGSLAAAINEARR